MVVTRDKTFRTAAAVKFVLYALNPHNVQESATLKPCAHPYSHTVSSNNRVVALKKLSANSPKVPSYNPEKDQTSDIAHLCARIKYCVPLLPLLPNTFRILLASQKLLI